MRFLVEEWQTEQYVQRIQRNRKELYVTCEEKCEGFLETEQWKCQSYAAAKRRLSLVYCYVQGGYDAVVVSSEDTDVFVLLLAFSSSIDASLFQK